MKCRTRRVTVSIGVSSSYVDGYNIQQMIISTDRALYRAKKNGRNRVETQAEKTEHLNFRTAGQLNTRGTIGIS